MPSGQRLVLKKLEMKCVKHEACFTNKTLSFAGTSSKYKGLVNRIHRAVTDTSSSLIFLTPRESIPALPLLLSKTWC